MTRVWTSGTWTVKPGNEVEFVVAWTAMRDAVLEEFGDVETPILLRDHERPNVFVSFGPWPDLEHVGRFRSSEQFRQAVAAMGPLLERFDAMTLDEVTR